MNERVLAQASKQLDKVAPRNMGLVWDDNLVSLEDGFIQAGELGVESSKRERKVEEEENSTAKRQRYNTMTEIINQREICRFGQRDASLLVYFSCFTLQ